MTAFLCAACGTQWPDAEAPPGRCPICEDERQFVPPGGQSWTTLHALRVGHSNAWRLLGLGPIDAYIRIGPPMPLDQFPDRKALARYAEDKVRGDVAELLRGGSESGAIAPKDAPEPIKTPALANPSKATSPASA